MGAGRDGVCSESAGVGWVRSVLMKVRCGRDKVKEEWLVLKHVLKKYGWVCARVLPLYMCDCNVRVHV